jgi:hypothetical protein
VDEKDAQIMVMEALKLEKESNVRFLKHVNIAMYGFHGRLLNMLHDGNVDGVIAELEAARRSCEERIINK